LVDGEKTVLRIGKSLIKVLGKEAPALRTFQVISGPDFDVPSTPYAL
jgi:hypothetical protein